VRKPVRPINWVDLLWLSAGSILFIFVGWKWNTPVAAWLSSVFLIRFLRNQDRGLRALIAVPFILIASLVNVAVTGDFSPAAEIGLSVFRAVPFLIALYADRFLLNKTGGIVSTLVFPAFYVGLDFLLSFLPTGTGFSISVSQFEMAPFIQLASVTGIWGISFIICWFASTTVTWWDNGFKVDRTSWPVFAFMTCFALVLLVGGLRIGAFHPKSDTVRIGSVTVEHETDYWAEIVDRGTPRNESDEYARELSDLQDRLFMESERVIQYGARIVFWSEGNVVLYEDDEADFIERAQAFAKENQVYFAPAILVLNYDEIGGDNKLVLIEPSGEIAYSYTKTKGWYPTKSDGILRTLETPYGRIGAAICVDMDFPHFINQMAKKGVDIVLVPAFDWESIKFHYQVGLFRAIENGFSVVRQTNEGISVAVDYRGRILAYQDFFATSDRTMISDVPTRGVKTVYAILGDWFAYTVILFVIVLIGVVVYRELGFGRCRA
jgi:apolipoprotein N-acyltransferase